MKLTKNGFTLSAIFDNGSKTLLIACVIASCFAFFNYVRHAELFPIRQVKVYGINHLARKEAQSLMQPLVKHGFFNIDVDLIRDRFNQLPWVSDASVRRHWPDKIEVVLREKNAVAVWNQQALLSNTGRVFLPEKTAFPSKLPGIIGPQGSQLYLLGYFKAINRLLSPLHAKIETLELTPSTEWRLTLQNGIAVRLGSEDILTQLQHFVKVYPKIIGDKANDVDYVDLRYPSGLAVRWKKTA